jgi:hypothetical protein
MSAFDTAYSTLRDIDVDCRVRAQTQVKPGQQLNVTFTDLPSAVLPPFNVSQT